MTLSRLTHLDIPQAILGNENKPSRAQALKGI